MIRTKLLLLFVLPGVLLFTSCSDLTNGDEDSDNGDDPIEPTATVDNPGDGATLEGEATFAVGGEAENGFTELRIFVGDEEVETVSDPSLPYEHTITTYDWDNGDYDLRAELDVAEQDTSVEASVSTTFENYMVTLETDGYIEMLNEYNEAAYMFIADPAGNVLREIELTLYSDGTIQLLPPSQIEGDAPEQFTVTVGQKRTNSQDNDVFYLNTDVGLQSWSTLNMTGSVPSDSEEPTYTDLTVEMSNFDQEPLLTYFFMESYPGYRYDSEAHQGDLNYTISISEQSNDLFVTHLPNWNVVDDPIPVYKWEENPTDLEGPVSYNVSEDFNQMQSHAVSNTSNINVSYYSIWMTIASDSFEDGDMPILFGNPSQVGGDANGSEAGFGIWAPKQISDRSFITYMEGRDQSNSDILHRFQTVVIDGFPDEFATVDADVQVNNQSMDNLELDVSGSADYLYFTTDASTDNYTQTWSVSMPDTMQSFTFPHIADSLDGSITNYDRSSFTFNYSNAIDNQAYEGYGEYLSSIYGTSDLGYTGGWSSKIKYLNTSQRVPLDRQRKTIEEGNTSSPVYLRNRSRNAEQIFPYQNQ